MRFLFLFLLICGSVTADEFFRDEIEPLLQDYCYDCHGDGAQKGGFVMDEYEDLAKHLGDVKHWEPVWRNLRSQIMPPSGEDQPDLKERKKLMKWIEGMVFKLDPERPDPGRVTIRRLNRMEYHHAVKDLLGVDFKTWENFPADDTGYGFDTIGDVLTISPLHMEKYLEAAELIARKALPVGLKKEMPVLKRWPGNFRMVDRPKKQRNWASLEAGGKVFVEFQVPVDGDYEVELDYTVDGATGYTEETGHFEFWVGDRLLGKRNLGWDQRSKQLLKRSVKLKKGKRKIELRVFPGKKVGQGQEKQKVVFRGVRLRGPKDGRLNQYSSSYRKVMIDGEPPKGKKERKVYAGKILKKLARRIYRREVDRRTLEKLVQMVMEVDSAKGKKFEDGIRQALTALLASPRFLFRAEIQPRPNDRGKVVDLDEFVLASRLSFFLWNSVPDDELLDLAKGGRLRKNLRKQVDRMLSDWRSRRFVDQFVGQWLQARDVTTVPVDARRILKVDGRGANQKFGGDVRWAMKGETEAMFEYVLKENRPAEELISAKYSFLNERLAKFYGVKGVVGEEMRYVDLKDYPERGGILGQGTFLVVTSNPTRTSPVKRGLFVLDHLLGTPAPPAPPGIPELEEAAHGKKKKLTMREMMEVHRKKAICASCHQRMDPIGLGLENFNALGMYREKERGKPIDTAGRLVTGERFRNLPELKKVLASSRRTDFYRCLSEKLLTYAIGRGMEYYDATTIDLLVKSLESRGGSLKELVHAVVESAPFQQRRGG